MIFFGVIMCSSIISCYGGSSLSTWADLMRERKSRDRQAITSQWCYSTEQISNSSTEYIKCHKSKIRLHWLLMLCRSWSCGIWKWHGVPADRAKARVLLEAMWNSIDMTELFLALIGNRNSSNDCHWSRERSARFPSPTQRWAFPAR